MDVLDVLQREHGHGARGRERQVRADQARFRSGRASAGRCRMVSGGSGGGATRRLRVLAVLEQRAVVVPEDHLRRIRCLFQLVTTMKTTRFIISHDQCNR